MEETQNAEVINVSLDQTIETKLVQANITDKVIAELKEKYGSLRLKAIDDKESYLEIKAAARVCAKLRTATVDVCKKGRDEAVKIQKKWITKEKEVVADIATVEDPLDGEIAKFDAEVERKDNEEKERKEAAYINRQQVLTKFGASYVDGSFELGAASFEAILIKESSDAVWDGEIVPKFRAEYEKIEAVRVAEEKKREEAAAELKRKEDELAEKERLFKEREAELQRQQDEADRKERERLAEEQRKANEANDKKFSERLALLPGWSFNGFTVSKHGEIFGSKADLYSIEDASFSKLVEDNHAYIAEQARLAEEKRLAQIEEAKQQAIRDEQARQEKERIAAEQKKADDEAKRIAELETASDKTKWTDFLSKVQALPDPEMRSGQYRKKMATAAELVAKILSL